MPKPPKVEPVPERQPARLPDNGDPTVSAMVRRRKLIGQAMTLPKLGLPSTATLGTG